MRRRAIRVRSEWCVGPIPGLPGTACEAARSVPAGAAMRGCPPALRARTQERLVSLRALAPELEREAKRGQDAERQDQEMRQGAPTRADAAKWACGNSRRTAGRS